MKSNKQLRVDAIGAQAAASNNHTFHTICKYNKLALLVFRDYARRMRATSRQAVCSARQAAARSKSNSQK